MQAKIIGVLILSSLAALAGDRKFSVAADWQTYVDNTYNVMLRCPADWIVDPQAYDRPYLGAEGRLGMVNRGFFQLLLEGDEHSTPLQSCKGHAEHVVRPFGANPSIRHLKVDGQDACLVWPSSDQGAPWDAALVVKYPTAVEVSGERWSLLELDADKDYITGIIRSLKFLSPSQKPPFSLEIAPYTHATSTGTGTSKPGAGEFVTVTMTNNTRQVLHFPFGKAGSDYQLNRDNDGWESRFGEEYLQLQREREGASVEAQTQVALKPQETYRTTIEVGSLVAPHGGPGKYSLEMQMKLPAELGPGLVRSNTVTIGVSE